MRTNRTTEWTHVYNQEVDSWNASNPHANSKCEYGVYIVHVMNNGNSLQFFIFFSKEIKCTIHISSNAPMHFLYYLVVVVVGGDGGITFGR